VLADRFIVAARQALSADEAAAIEGAAARTVEPVA
jgi:hypothetical protein